jgi:hypothetical protein
MEEGMCARGDGKHGQRMIRKARRRFDAVAVEVSHPKDERALDLYSYAQMTVAPVPEGDEAKASRRTRDATR